MQVSYCDCSKEETIFHYVKRVPGTGISTKHDKTAAACASIQRNSASRSILCKSWRKTQFCGQVPSSGARWRISPTIALFGDEPDFTSVHKRTDGVQFATSSTGLFGNFLTPLNSQPYTYCGNIFWSPVQSGKNPCVPAVRQCNSSQANKFMRFIQSVSGDRKQVISSFATYKPVQSIFYLPDIDMLSNKVKSNNSSTESNIKAFKVQCFQFHQPKFRTR